MVFRYWGFMLIQLFSIAWCLLVGTVAVDLTLIGHIRGWKRIRYPKWLGGAIDKNRLYGFELLNDQITHPQILWFLCGSILAFAGIVVLIVFAWRFVNDVDTWFLWLIDAALYLPASAGFVFSKLFAKHVYLSYQEHSKTS